MLDYAPLADRQEAWEESSELTSIQRKMFICNKLPIYRLPLLYPLEPGISYAAVKEALYAAFEAHKTLQVKYTYEPQLRKFYQRYTPLQPEDFIVESVRINEPPDQYIRSLLAGIDLSADYPWRLAFLEWRDERYLWAEFHHIVIDGLGIRRFEQDFTGRLLEGQEVLPQASLPLSSYRRICELQRDNSSAPEATGRLLKLPELQDKPVSGVGRLTVPLDNNRQEAVQRLAKQLNVTKNAVFQGVLEEVLSCCCSGDTYGTIGNWRMSLGNFTEAGCYVRLMPKRMQAAVTTEDRIRTIHRDNLQTLMIRSNELPEMTEYPVMYSYEEDMFRHFRYIPADRMCKFQLYIRVYCYRQENGIEAEYSKAKYTEEQISAIISEFSTRLDYLAE
ncbi:condensation domain-containing protein [Paenibacillus ihuae]|uniref:condensation domain-containing protein n=1 Tax=Paenibacillus ihuae TaxID=1232431 RepID=UPI0006D593AE|nr:condensation domain-containing protein [Paenibacillus ihuae]